MKKTELNDIETVEELGKYIEELRGNVSARQLSKGICRPEHLRFIEKGERLAGDLIMYKIAKRLNVNPKELIFAIKRIQAPDETKEFYKNINNSNHTHRTKQDKDSEKDDEMADLKKGHHNLEGEVTELKEMIKKQENMMKKMLDLLEKK